MILFYFIFLQWTQNRNIQLTSSGSQEHDYNQPLAATGLHDWMPGAFEHWFDLTDQTECLALFRYKFININIYTHMWITDTDNLL